MEKFKKIEEYCFLYSIEDKILQDYDDNNKLNILKNTIDTCDNNKIKIGLYYLKKNCVNYFILYSLKLN